MTGAAAAVPEGLTLVSIADRPELWGPLDELCGSVWPELMLHDPVADRCWAHLREDWPQFQLAAVDAEGRIVAGGNAAPLWWDGTDEGLPDGWDDQFERSIAGLSDWVAPNALGAIQIVVAPDRRGTGLSAVVLDAMRSSARAARLGSLVACVRPTLKASYPLMPIEVYTQWRRDDGLPFDPWLRVHVRAGGRIVRPSPASMRIEGSVAEMESWTGLRFPVSGPYVAEGALSPIEVDLAEDRAVYLDPNIWVAHGV